MQLEDGEFKLLSYTSSKALRNCYIRKLIEKGEYVILIEKDTTLLNEKLEEKAPDLFKNWRDVVLSSYGPSTCSMVIEECKEKHFVFDYVSY